MENLRRENVSQNEQTQVRLRQEISDVNNQTMQRTTDKLERLKDELEYKTKENEKVNEKRKHMASGDFCEKVDLDDKRKENCLILQNRIIKLNMNNVKDKCNRYKTISNNK